MPGDDRVADPPSRANRSAERHALRFALLGTAHVHVPDYLTVLARDDRARLVSVFEADPRWQRPFGLPRVPIADSAASALTDADAVIVASTTNEHAELASAVAKAGVPALFEKPLGADVRQTFEIAELLTTSGQNLVTTAMFLRAAPALRRLRTVYRSGALGEPVHVSAAFTHDGLRRGLFTGPNGWMLDPAFGATGAFADLGIHLVDMLLWLDPRRPMTVRRAHFCAGGDGDRLLPGLDVAGRAVLDWGDVPTRLRASWTDARGGIRVRIVGTRGAASLDATSLTLDVGDARRVERWPAPYAGAALEGFIGGVLGHGTWQPPTMRHVMMCAQVLHSAAAVADRSSRSCCSARPTV